MAEPLAIEITDSGGARHQTPAAAAAQGCKHTRLSLWPFGPLAFYGGVAASRASAPAAQGGGDDGLSGRVKAWYGAVSLGGADGAGVAARADTSSLRPLPRLLPRSRCSNAFPRRPYLLFRTRYFWTVQASPHNSFRHIQVQHCQPPFPPSLARTGTLSIQRIAPAGPVGSQLFSRSLCHTLAGQTRPTCRERMLP
eukprot:gene17671-biopygen11097